MRGLLARVRQRRGGDARRGRLRLAKGVRARDEPPRAAARAHEHALREPDRPRRAGQLLHRARPRDARHASCARTRSSSKIVDSPRGDAARPAIHPRTFDNRNDARAQLPVGQRRQDRPHPAAPATCWSARASRNGIQLDLRRARHAERGRARRRHDRAAARGPSPRFQRIRARDPARHEMAACRSATAAAPSSTLVAGRTVARGSSAAATAMTSRCGRRRARATSTGPDPQRPARSGASRSCRAARVVATVPLVAASERPGRRASRRRTKAWFTTPAGRSCSRSPCWSVRSCSAAGAARGPRAGVPRREARAA